MIRPKRYYYRYKGYRYYSFLCHGYVTVKAEGHIYKLLTEGQALRYCDECSEIWEKVEEIKKGE